MAQSWKKKLLNVSELQTKSRESLHQRVSLLLEIFDDRDFRADNGNFDDFSAAELLDKYLEDTALSFLECRAVLLVFPALATWHGKSLRDLYAAALESSTLAKADTEKPARTHRSVTIKDFEASQIATKDAEARCRFVESQVKTVTSELEELRGENRRLLAENARLEGRISELERFVARDREVAQSARGR